MKDNTIPFGISDVRETYEHATVKNPIRTARLWYQSTKTYGHEVGLSCCFRQWRAESHCSKMHGYALSFSFTFETGQLDENGWVVDFGALKELKEALVDIFDHKMLVAKDDPMLESIQDADWLHIADVVIVDAVGCEAFAKMGFDLADLLIAAKFPHARVVSCKVSEHGANSATYCQKEILK